MQLSKRAIITSMGHFHPPYVIKNSFFDTLNIDSQADWVEDRTGIKSRRSVLNEEQIRGLREKRLNLDDLRQSHQFMSIGSMAKPAWEMACSRQPGTLPEIPVDILTCGTSVPDFDIPANAATIAAEIGLETTTYDVNSACSSFVVNLHHARAMILSGLAQRVSCFTPERYSLRLNYADRASCVLFGDGCAAADIRANSSTGLEILDTIVVSTPSKFDLVQIPVAGHFNQNGKAVQKFAITRTIDVTMSILERNGFTLDDVSYLVGHQANLRMLTTAVQKLGIGEDRHLYNVDEFGNQGGAGAPCVLSTHWDKLQSGDLIVVSVVGSGLTWGSALLRKL